MQREIEVFEFFSEKLKSDKERRILLNLVNFHDVNIRNGTLLKKYHNQISTPYNCNVVMDGCSLGSNYFYWLGMGELNNFQKLNLMTNIKVFEKDKFYEIFSFFKKTITNFLVKIDKKEVDKFLAEVEFTLESKINFMTNMFICGLNNILMKNYDVYVENVVKNNDFNVEEKYEELVNKIKKCFVENITISSGTIDKYFNDSNNSNYKRGKFKLNCNDHKNISSNEIIEKHFNDLKNAKSYYKIFKFNFDGNKFDISNYELYSKLYDLLIEEFNDGSI